MEEGEVMKISLILIFFISILLITTATAAPPTQFKEVSSAGGSGLSGKIFVNDSATGYSAEWIADGRIAISSIIHETNKTVCIQMNALSAVNGFSGNSAKVTHINDAGVIDSERIVNFGASDAQGFVYFTTDFSTVVIGGYQGSYTVAGVVQDNSTNLSLGQSFPGGNVSALSATITPATTEISKYDYIASINPVLWLPLDDNYTDSSGNGYNGTAYGSTNFVNAKYNNGSSFDGDGDYISIPNSSSLIFSDKMSIVFDLKLNELGVYHGIVSKGDSIWTNYSFGVRVRDSTNKLELIMSSTGSDVLLYGPGNSLDADISYHYTIIYDRPNISIYSNNVLQGSTVWDYDLFNSSADVGIGMYAHGSGLGFLLNGTTDNILLYDYAINETERNNIYYDHLQQLRIRTTTNATWSDYYNSTADNPISINYNIGETISALQFDVPTTAVINGVTIYDYNKTAQFTPSAIVYYGENTTLVSETATAGQYHLNISFTPANSGTGWINYTTSNTLLLNADFNNAATFSSTETNATLAAETLPSFNISTGYMQAGIPKTFNISIDYFYPPASFSIIESSSTWINTSWAGSPNADKYSLYRDDVFIANTTNLYYTYTGLSPFVGYMLNVSVWNGSRETSQASLLEYTVSPTSTIITFLDLLQNSDTEFHIYNASGYLVTTVSSNGSSYTLPRGAYVVQVLPSDAGYRDSPIKLFDLFFIAVGAVFGFILLAVLVAGLLKIIRKTMEVWM